MHIYTKCSMQFTCSHGYTLCNHPAANNSQASANSMTKHTADNDTKYVLSGGQNDGSQLRSIAPLSQECHCERLNENACQYCCWTFHFWLSILHGWCAATGFDYIQFSAIQVVAELRIRQKRWHRLLFELEWKIISFIVWFSCFFFCWLDRNFNQYSIENKAHRHIGNRSKTSQDLYKSLFHIYIFFLLS